jgi:hypothetical protein
VDKEEQLSNALIQLSARDPDMQLRFVRRIRLLLWVFIIGLVVSGATAMPLESELRILTSFINGNSGTALWLARVRQGLIATNAQYPFIAYGTDWLAFGHFMIALAFIGPLRDPMKNIWIIEFGMLACVLVIPFAMIMGGVRGIPFGWRLIDCCFGIFGLLPLWYCRRQIKILADYRMASQPQVSE